MIKFLSIFINFLLVIFIHKSFGIPFRGKQFTELNNRPIIGILAQEITPGLLPPEIKGDSYLAASYVKYIESAGGRVVPILTTTNEEELKVIFNSINGVLFPGGDADLFTSKYYKNAKSLYDMAVKANSQGDSFPIWGTCLGMQALSTITAGVEVVSPSDAVDISWPLNFTATAKESRMLKDAPEDLIMMLEKEAITYNYHYNCVTPETFETNRELKKHYNVLSLNNDVNGKTFVSTFEGVKHPFFATQWHPEKNSFEWNPKKNIAHTRDAVDAAQYFANFFVDEARESQHRFESEEIENKYLIYKYSPIFTGSLGHFEQSYVF
eukprot:gene351-984_t